MTCPHCANFHISIYENLKKDFIDNGLVKFEHHAFPLDLAALNAEIIVRCHINKDKKFKLLEKMYEKQKDWAIGSDINKINDSIKKIGAELNLEDKKMSKCLNDEKVQDDILNQRIDAQKKYKISLHQQLLLMKKIHLEKIIMSNLKKL